MNREVPAHTRIEKLLFPTNTFHLFLFALESSGKTILQWFFNYLKKHIFHENWKSFVHFVGTVCLLSFEIGLEIFAGDFFFTNFQDVKSHSRSQTKFAQFSRWTNQEALFVARKYSQFKIHNFPANLRRKRKFYRFSSRLRSQCPISVPPFRTQSMFFNEELLSAN